MFKAYQAISPAVEVDGRTVLADIDGILVGAVRRELFESCGLVNVSAQGWYSQQLWLNVYRKISDELGADTLYSIGRRIPYNADFPAEQMRDVPTALESIDVAYHRSHRGGEIGHYKYVCIGLDHYEVHCDNPYPNEFDLGIVTSLVERFRGRIQYKVRVKQRAMQPEVDNACILEVVRI